MKEETKLFIYCFTLATLCSTWVLSYVVHAYIVDTAVEAKANGETLQLACLKVGGVWVENHCDPKSADAKSAAK